LSRQLNFVVVKKIEKQKIPQIKKKTKTKTRRKFFLQKIGQNYEKNDVPGKKEDVIDS